MSGCVACPRRCGAERSQTTGACGVGAAFRVARIALHHWEEPCISGMAGSGAVFFSGCPLKCVFCQNAEISRGCKGVDITEEQLIAAMQRLVDAGAQNINLVSPTQYAPALAHLLQRWKPPVPVVYNTGGYERVETLRMLEGLVDIYLPDLKYTRPDKAAAYSAVPDYVQQVQPALLEMRRQVQDRFEGEQMRSGMIVRHLILPGNTNSSVEALNWLHTHLPDTYVSLMAQYTPMPDLEKYPELTRTVTRREYDKVVAHALDLGMDKVFLQARTAADKNFIPAFDFTGIV